MINKKLFIIIVSLFSVVIFSLFTSAIVVGTSKTNINKASIELLLDEYEYTGEEITPVYSVIYNNNSLQLGRDYYISLSNNIDCGDASIRFKGIGKFKGSKTLPFTIYEKLITVNFDLNGGILDEGLLTQEVSKASFIKVPKFHRDGYTFVGFNKSIEDITMNETITAIWEENIYSITIDLSNCGTYEIESDAILDNVYIDNLKYSDVFVLPDIIFEGKTLLGYGDGYKLYTDDITNILDNLNLEPVFKDTLFNIEYYTKNKNIDIKKFAFDTNYYYNDDFVLNNLEHEGYTFDGYYIDGKKINTVDTKIVGNQTVEVRFKPIDYNITYIVEDDVINPNKITKYNAEDDNILLKEPTKGTYVFLGWYYNDEIVTVIDTSLCKDIEVEALFVFEAYTIKYEDVFDANNPNPHGYYYDESVALDNISRKGYKFNGWYLDDTLITFIEKGTNKDIVLKAKWEVIKYEIKFDLNGGSDSNGNTTINSIFYTIEDNTISLPNDIYLYGTTFKGWQYNNTLWENIDSTLCKNIIMIARYEYNTYPVSYSYVTNIGSVTNQNKVIKDNKLLSNYSVEMGNFIFDDLNVDYFNVTKIVLVGTNTSSNIELCEIDNIYLTEGLIKLISSYEKEFNKISFRIYLEAKVYTITFDASNGIYSNGTNKLIYNLTYFDKLFFNNVEIPTLANYDFKEYQSNGVKLTSGLAGVSKDMTIEVIYTFKGYLINLYIDNIYFGKDYLLPNTDIYYPTKTVSRDYYVFDGWYYNGSKLESIDTSIDSNLHDYNLFGYFIPKTFNITYIGLDDLSEYQSTYKYKENIVLVDPFKDGYIFIGWYYNNELITNFSNFIGDITIEARFEEINYTYLNIVDETSQTISTRVDKGETIKLDYYSKYSGYIYKYYSDIDLTNEIDLDITIEDDITIYSKLYYEPGEGFIPYLNEFQDDSTPQVLIESQEELTAYMDYVAYRRLQSTTKGLLITYMQDEPTCDTNDDIKTMVIEPAFKQMSFGTGSLQIGYGFNGNYIIATIKANIECNNENTLSYVTTPMYTSLKGYNSINYGSRDTTNEYFKYLDVSSYKRTVAVENSEQLRYVLEHGYIPQIKEDSEAEVIYNKAKSILNKIVDDNMNDYEKLLQIYKYITENNSYDYVVADKSTSNSLERGWQYYHSWFIEGTLVDGISVCDGIAKAYALLARIEGIGAIRCVSSTHAWNKVFYDGMWYVVDATHGDTLTPVVNMKGFYSVIDGEIINSFNTTYEYTTYDQFMISDETKHNKGSSCNEITYTNIIALGEIDYYKNNTFTFEGNEYDYFIGSDEEFRALIGYCMSNYTKGDLRVVEFVLKYEYNTDYRYEILSKGESGYKEFVRNIIYSINLNYSYTVSQFAHFSIMTEGINPIIIF